MLSMGTYRTNSMKQVKNSPNVPMNVAQSQMVGEYRPHMDGTSSRVSVITITYRSNHMPTSTITETTNNTTGFIRHFLTQRTCGATKLQKIRHQYDHPNGPNIRSYVVPHSYLLWLYHDIHSSEK